MLYYEKKLKKKGYNLIIGVDEAGRGPLAGPVVAAAVTLGTSRFKSRIDDSKKLTPLSRERAFQEIAKKCTFGVGIINEGLIDNLNILEATRLAMEEAITSLTGKLKSVRNKRIHIMVDGNVAINVSYPYIKIVNGDSKSKSIACASIVAKVIRDRIMGMYDEEYPQYGFIRHKGYPTKEHRNILKRIGPSLIHRKTFCCVR